MSTSVCGQVEEHASRESSWFVYEGKVYDATKFLNDHPGGPESILIVAGQVGSACIQFLLLLFHMDGVASGSSAPVSWFHLDGD